MTARRYTSRAAQLRRTAELDALRLHRPLTDQEAAEADRLAHKAYMRAWHAAQTEHEQALRSVKGVVIESRPAIEVMRQHDSAQTLHYVDPPYLHATRSRAHRRADNGGVYRHELDDAGHLELLAVLQSLEGMVILSGYPSETYDAALQGWHRVERSALADGALKRTEVLWLNPAAKRAMPQADLWSSAA